MSCECGKPSPHCCLRSWGNFYPGHHCKLAPGHEGDHECECGQARSELLLRLKV